MIREYIETLNSFTESDWCRYAFRHEPLSGKLTFEQRLEYFREAARCGAMLASSLTEKLGELPVADYAHRKGVKVILDEPAFDSMWTTFALFRHPNEVTIFLNNAQATDLLIAENGLVPIVGNVKTQDLLLAHELFHFYENRMPDLYVNKKHILLFRIGHWENRSRLLCLSEVAAMSFAKALTGLPCSPYLYDVLMLYTLNPQRARSQYDMIMRIVKEKEQ